VQFYSCDCVKQNKFIGGTVKLRIIGYAFLVALIAFTSFLSFPAGAYAWAGLKSDSPGIDQGGSATLAWSLDSGESPRITPGVGAVASEGEVMVKPDKTTTYVLTADTYMFGQHIPLKYEVTVTVIPKP
jgi:hypothetical protein